MTMTTPPTAQYAGSTDGSFEVNEHGGATYTIPLQIPPGTNNVQPALSLAYDSAAGNDMLGVGWRLRGFSAISRTGATPAQDGFWAGVTFDDSPSSTDRLLLDGQRLVPDVPSGSSRYLGNPGVTYRTEIDTFSKIVPTYVGGRLASFTVFTKNGTR